MAPVNTDDAAEVPENAAEIAELFPLERSYLKDLSFETPAGARTFTVDWEPVMTCDVSGKAERLGKNVWEVVLIVNFSVRLKTALVLQIEAHQAGIYDTEKLDRASLRFALTKVAPATLFPAVSNTISNLSENAGFPKFELAPIDFHSRTIFHPDEIEPPPADTEDPE